MGLVERLPFPPHVTAALAALVFTGSVAYCSWFMYAKLHPPRPPERVSMAFYYDQNTGQLFEAPADLPPPLETESGLFQGLPAGVPARVFSCGQTLEPAQRFVGWLEMPVAALRNSAAPLPAERTNPDERSAIVIRRPGDTAWVYPASREGARIMEQAREHCSSDEGFFMCHPRRRLRSEVNSSHLAALGALPREQPD